MSIDDRIAKLEREGGGVPGTTIQRVLRDVAELRREGIALPPETDPRRESIPVWAIGIGRLQEPKRWHYGFTIEAALNAAEAS